MSNTRRVGFRGETRLPDEIFQKGFETKSGDSKAPMKYSGDSDPDYAVSVTWRLGAATYFPYKTEVKETWLYVVNIDLSTAKEDAIFNSRVNPTQEVVDKAASETSNSFANIHGAQVLDVVQKRNPSDSRSYADIAKKLFFADEVAAKKIKPEDVLFAVRCPREWKSDDASEGGTYKLEGKILVNPRANTTTAMAKLAYELLEKEIAMSEKEAIPMPTPQSGFSVNEHAPVKEEEIKKNENVGLDLHDYASQTIFGDKKTKTDNEAFDDLFKSDDQNAPLLPSKKDTNAPS